MEELDLKEIFSLFWGKKVIIILFILVFVFIGACYSYFYIKPVYTASTDLILVQSSNNKAQTLEDGITTTDLTMNSKLVSTYSEIIKKNTVLGQVATNLSLSTEEVESLKNKISVKRVKDTEIIGVNVTDADPQYATKVANEIAAVFSEKVVDIFNISNTYILDRAKVPTEPSNINHAKDLVIFAFVGFIISAVYVLIVNMLDNTIKEEVDIEKTTGLIVLTSIPDYEAELKSKKGGKR